MAVTVDEYDRLFEKNRLTFQHVDELIKPARKLIRSPKSNADSPAGSA